MQKSQDAEMAAEMATCKNGNLHDNLRKCQPAEKQLAKWQHAEIATPRNRKLQDKSFIGAFF